KRLLLSGLAVGMFVSLLGIISSIFIQSSWPAIIIASVTFLFLIIVFYLVRFRNIYSHIIVPLISLAFVAIGIIWVFDGGIDGSAIFIAYVIFILSLIIVPVKRKKYVLFGFLALIIALYSIEIFRPEWIGSFSSERERWIDSLLTAVYCSVFIFMIIKFLHRNYADERRKAEKSEARIRSIMENSADAIFVTDRGGRYLYANRTASGLLGYTQEEMLGMTIADLSPPGKLDEHLEIFREIMDKGSAFAELELRKKNGEYISTDLNAMVLPDGTVYGSCRDISVRKRALAAIKDNEERLRQLNADKDLFISIMSHDLKGPFQSLMGLSGMLKEEINDMDSGEIRDILDLLNSSSKKTYELLEDLLKWGRSQQGKLPFNPVMTGLRDIYNDATGLLKPAAERKNITMEYEAPEDISIYADRDMVHTILRNLLSNAIKFTGENGEVRLRAERRDKGTVVSVIDNGVGIKPADRKKLFDIASVFTTEGTAQEKGTGLGLLLCKEFTEKHGGKIYVESSPGKGSVFSFYLPGPPQ
ncbi:MAG: ATP-binding protein, partial [Bacteroidales bacterium]